MQPYLNPSAVSSNDAFIPDSHAIASTSITSLINASDISKEMQSEIAEPLYYDHVLVVGPLDLKYRLIKRPIILTNCIFYDPVDLRYTDFLQPFDVSGSIFMDEFNSGDEIESFTCYRKDLICNRVQFRGRACFNGARVEGSAFFNHSMFLSDLSKDDVYDNDFITFYSKGHIECLATTFKGRTSFNAMECASALFRGTHFEHTHSTVDFRNAKFERNLEFGPWEKGDDIQPTIFRGGLDCYGIWCGRKVIMRKAQFQSGQKAVMFKRAHFGWLLNAEGAQFAGPVEITGADCDGDVLLKDTTFRFHTTHSQVDSSSSDQQIQRADIYCEDDIDLRFIHVQGNLDLRYADFEGVLNLGQASIAGKLRFGRAKFHDQVKLYDANIKILELWSKDEPIDSMPTFPFKPASLDLTCCSFERFHAHSRQAGMEWCLARKLAEAQNPGKFSRDPYLQLEKYYKSNGQEHAARDIHLEGHRAMREHAKRNESIIWSNSQWLKDGFLMWSTGWGLQNWRLLVASLIILLFGTAVFFMFNSQPLLQSFAYSVDLFVPALDLGFTDNVVPKHPFLTIYASIHVILGWILIPLYIASLTGIIQSD